MLRNRNYVSRYIRIASKKSWSFCIINFSVLLTNSRPLLPQSHDSSRYVSRPILALAPLWLHKHNDLRAQNFAHSHEKSHDLGSLSFEAGEFVELLLLHQTAYIRQIYHLSFIKYTAAVLKAVMCDSDTSFVLSFWGSRGSVEPTVNASFHQRMFLLTSWSHYVCFCHLAYRFVY